MRFPLGEDSDDDVSTPLSFPNHGNHGNFPSPKEILNDEVSSEKTFQLSTSSQKVPVINAAAGIICTPIIPNPTEPMIKPNQEILKTIESTLTSSPIITKKANMPNEPTLLKSPLYPHKDGSPHSPSGSHNRPDIIKKHSQTSHLPNNSSHQTSNHEGVSAASSLSSGPMFPPGFESHIPTEAKIQHAKRRIRKIQKKKKQKNLKQPSPLSFHSIPPPLEITSSDVLSLASELGLKIDGPISCIESLIDAIIKRQQADWASAKT